MLLIPHFKKRAKQQLSHSQHQPLLGQIIKQVY